LLDRGAWAEEIGDVIALLSLVELHRHKDPSLNEALRVGMERSAMSAPGPLRRRNAITRGQGDLCRLGGAVQLRLHTERAGSVRPVCL
jgi:hypothetical protein